MQIHHIKDWAKVREHAFENLILLCANCHARVTSGDIDRQSVLAYKTNLSILASRYGDLERRILDRFVRYPEEREIVVDVGHTLLMDYLIADGVLIYLGPADGALFIGAGDPPPDDEMVIDDQGGPARWGLTLTGRNLIKRLREAREVP